MIHILVILVVFFVVFIIALVLSIPRFIVRVVLGVVAVVVIVVILVKPVPGPVAALALSRVLSTSTLAIRASAASKIISRLFLRPSTVVSIATARRLPPSFALFAAAAFSRLPARRRRLSPPTDRLDVPLDLVVLFCLTFRFRPLRLRSRAALVRRRVRSFAVAAFAVAAPRDLLLLPIATFLPRPRLRQHRAFIFCGLDVFRALAFPHHGLHVRVRVERARFRRARRCVGTPRARRFRRFTRRRGRRERQQRVQRDV